ncbi:macrolide family glycosyltransferase [Bacillus swezeyi]|uniref:UDP-glucosyltransferase n=2 Tax=Bacillus swezeyi TaxID=1925020 RepID=A0A5M8RJ46_9BACI|nr:macrolide family glycosyltransferase [Bacillus swezeyi]KAA6447861.1 UDP-glucosyltransferase [Bacillus swezeyi]TYS34366.1 UDP-glucosyltransferase [Bacillus swezeyi]
MTNVLIVNFPAEGHVNPTLGITKAFADRGDNVHYISTEKYKDRLEGVGATVHLYDDLVRNAHIDPNSPSGVLAFLKIHLKTSLYILEIAKELAKTIQFDVVYYDKFGGGELVRDYLKIPGIASSASFLFGEEHLKILPLHPDSGMPLELDKECEDLFAELKDKYGVLPRDRSQFMDNRAEMTVVYTSRYFQPDSHRYGDEFLFIGPSFPKRLGKNDFPIDTLRGYKVIYISMGTVLDKTTEFFNMCIDAFSDFEGKVVIAAGERSDYRDTKEAPGHFIIAPYVPQLDVLQEADVFITHGGMNSVNEGIHYQVPMVVLPHDKDQPMVAQRLAELNAGYPIATDEVNEQILRHAVDQVLNDRTYREGIQKIDESFRNSMDMKEALDLIDQYIVQSKPLQ